MRASRFGTGILAAFVLSAACGTASPQSDAGGTQCQADDECTGGDYCDVPLTDCPGVPGNVTAATGECHRNCFAAGCTCATDADCPGGRCNLDAGSTAQCAQIGAGCLEPLRCSPGCIQENLVEACPVCVCPTCPPPDGG